MPSLSLPRLLLGTAIAATALAHSLHAQAARPLASPTAEAIRGRAYGLEFSHTVAFQGERAGNAIGREARLRVSFDAGQRRGATHETVVRIDSARGSASTPHNREVLDLRGLMATRITATYGDSGAPVTFANAPVLSFGDLGSRDLASVLPALFPSLPARVTKAGDTWDRTSIRNSIHGQVAIRHEVRTRYTLEGFQQSAGVRVARIRFATTGAAGAPPAFKSGGTMLVGAEDGVLHELTLEETMTGTWDFNGEALPFVQTDELRVVLRPAAPAPARR